MSPEDLLDLLGNVPGNELTLPALIQQLQTPIGVVPFIGAGLSVPAGYPAWSVFLSDAARLANAVTPIKKRLAAGEYEEAAEDLIALLTPARFQDLMEHHFGDRVLTGKTFTGAVTTLPRLTTGPVITTNFDRLLEQVFLQAGWAFVNVIGHAKLDHGVRMLETNGHALLKLHGTWDDPTNRVLTATEYRASYWDPNAAPVAGAPIPTLFTLLGARPLLFIGCNLAEDRTVAALQRVAQLLTSSRHYAIVQRPKSAAKLRARDQFLARCNIRPLWYPEGEHQLLEPLLDFLSQQIPAAYRAAAQPAPPPPAPPTDSIPTLLTTFIGRTRELGELRTRTLGTRLLTLSGPPGVGKTRLAIELTRSLTTEFEAVWFVELSQMADAHLVAQRVATELGIREQARRPPTESLAEFLGDHAYLIVLDNCEHVRAACTGLVDYLLRACPHLTIIATTREILKVAGEDVYSIPPLDRPDPNVQLSLDALRRVDAISLFLARAGASFQLTAQNASDIVRLCAELEGIPLAIELAAAQLSLLSIKQLLAQMGHRLSVLRGGRGGEYERQWGTLQEAIRFSYDMLEPNQQVVLRRLSAFRGGCTWAAATAVCGTGLGDSYAVLDHINELMAKSLLVGEPGLEERRYRMLDSIRQYAASLLVAGGEGVGVGDAHAAWFVALAEQAAPELLKGDQARWLELLVEDADNFRAAIGHAITTGDTELGLRLMVGLWRLTEIRGYWREGRERLEMVLAMPGADGYPTLRGKALSGLGQLAYRQGDMERAKTTFTESLNLATIHSDAPARANALNDLGNVAQQEGDFDAAYRYYAESLDLETATGNARGVAVSLFNAGNSARRLGRLSEAKDLLARSQHAFHDAGNFREEAFPLNALAQLAIGEGRYAEALAIAETSFVIRQKLSDKKGIGDCLRTKGAAHLGLGAIETALGFLSDSLDNAKSVEDKRGIAETLEQFAHAALLLKYPATCAALYGAAQHIRDDTHVRLAPAERIQPDADLEAVKQALSEADTEQHLTRGRAATSEQVNALVATLEGAGIEAAR